MSGKNENTNESDQGYENTAPTKYVPMPENGLVALSAMTGLTEDELFEINKDLLSNKLSFTVGQMVRIPA